jgi:hypothetical protein
LFVGWRLRRLIREGTNQDAIAHIKAQQIFRTTSCFEEFHHENQESGWNRDRMLFVSERNDALSLPGSVAAIIFAYHDPILRLREHDQELLRTAMTGLTDEELARTLHMKLATVKKRWAAVFNHVALAKPDLLPDHKQPHSPGRGPQKRHRLLEYLRHHPEELRPIAEPARAAVSAESNRITRT